MGWSGDVSAFIHVVKVPPRHTHNICLLVSTPSSLEIWMIVKLPRLTLGAM